MPHDSNSADASSAHNDASKRLADLAARDESSVESVFAACIDRLLNGETINLEEVACKHPEVDEDVLEQLRSFCDLADDSQETLGSRRIGDFEIIREVGRGGMGIVYEAVQISLGRRVALKVIPAGLAADAKAVARFIREAQVSAKLDHPNVVTVFEMGVDQHVPYYAMEFVEGQTLATRLNLQREQAIDGSSPELQSRRYYIELANCFAGAAEGLAHAHRRGVIHRDVKPSNLIFDSAKQSADTSEELLRMLDFGLARFDGQESLTASGDVVGSVRYMSPEQASVVKGSPIDHRTDVYSLGATFYETLTLQPPFKGRDIQDTISQIQTRDPKPPTRLNPRIPRDMETIVMKCLRKDPNDRYGSADALAQDLGRFLRGDIIEARPLSAFEQSSRWLQRHKVQLAVVTCFLVLITTSILSLWKSQVMADRNRDRSSRQEVVAAAESLRSAPISLIEATPHDLYLLPAGRYRFFLSKKWAPPPTEDAKATVLKVVDKLNSAIDLSPKLADAYWHRARAKLLIGKLPEALDDLNQLLKLDREHVPAWLLKAALHAHLGNRKESQEARNEGGRPTAGSLYGPWLEAHHFAKRRDYANATDKFQQALEEAEKQQEPYIGWTRETELALAICLQKSGDFVGSLIHLHGDTDDVRVQKAIAYIGLAKEARDGERYEQDADAIFQALGHSAKADVATLVIQEYRRLYRHRRISQLDWKFIDQWLQRIPSESVRLRIQALCCFHDHRFKDGAKAMRAAIKLSPEDASLYHFFAEDGYCMNLTEPGSHDAVLNLLTKAVELEPTNVEYRSSLAFWSLRFGVPDAAEHHLQVIERQLLEPFGYWSNINLALSYGLLGDLQRAEKLFEQADAIKRSHWTEHNRGLMYRMLADRAADQRSEEIHLRTAEDAYSAAIRLNPKVPMNYRAKAKILKRLEGNEAAIACLERGWSDAYRHDAEIARRLGVWHQELGDFEQAGSWLLKSIKMNSRRPNIHQDVRNLLSARATDDSSETYTLITFLEDLLEDSAELTPQGEHRVRVMTTLALALETVNRSTDGQPLWVQVMAEISAHQYEDVESELAAANEALQGVAYERP